MTCSYHAALEPYIHATLYVDIEVALGLRCRASGREPPCCRICHVAAKILTLCRTGEHPARIKQAANKKAARSTTVPQGFSSVPPPAHTSSGRSGNGSGNGNNNQGTDENEPRLDLENSHFIGSGSLLDMLDDASGDEEEFDAEIEAFKMKLEMSQPPPERPKPKITLNPEAFKTLRSLKQ